MIAAGFGTSERASTDRDRSAAFTVREYGQVSVLVAENGGILPHGNSVLVHGSEGDLLVDPSLAVDDDPVHADVVVISHAHEDHLAGLRQFSAPTYAHHADAAAVGSLELLIDQYGLRPEDRPHIERFLDEQYTVPATRDGVIGIDDGHVFDLGDRTATLVHLPGHTPGHAGLLVEPDGFFYVADIDLTSFGPMYGDVDSSVDLFLASIDLAATIDARWYGTFHHKGVVEGSAEFRRRLAAYRAVVLDREDRILAYLTEPRTLAEIAAHRFIYRHHVTEPYVDTVERRTARRHLDRLLAAGAVAVDDDGRYRQLTH